MSRELKKIKKNQIRRYRKERYLRQRDIAILMGLKQPCDIYRWETGEKLPSLMNVLKLSVALKCPVEILFLDHYKEIQRQMNKERLE
jgi:transcriptional regulator with XRE-family HTH domain